MNTKSNSEGSRCPHCHSETEISRSEVRPLPGDLAMEEFEALVRAEWRRRLGPSRYPGYHPGELIRALGRATVWADWGLLSKIKTEMEWIIADLRLKGAGRQEIRHELAVLVRAIRAVLWKAGVQAEAAQQLVAPLRMVIDKILSFPAPEEEVWAGPSPQEERGSV